jgi:hypothetical protein
MQNAKFKLQIGLLPIIPHFALYFVLYNFAEVPPRLLTK